MANKNFRKGDRVIYKHQIYFSEKECRYFGVENLHHGRYLDVEEPAVLLDKWTYDVDEDYEGNPGPWYLIKIPRTGSQIQITEEKALKSLKKLTSRDIKKMGENFLLVLRPSKVSNKEWFLKFVDTDKIKIHYR